MFIKASKPLIVFVLFVLFVGMACSVSLGGEPAATSEPTAIVETQAPEVQPTSPPEQAPTEEPAVTEEPQSQSSGSISDAKDAIIQIEAQGTFIDPEVGLQLNQPGRGSGFIIDPSGIAVTNNHVVTGAALVKVRLAGEDEWRNARVLGVSECSDLAVIDIEGDGYPYLDWYQGDIDPGMEVYVAGFPLGDPEYTLTKGVISKSSSVGETSWASIDSMLEYDASTLPGNSGGPVLDANADVVGVHFAWNADTRQNFGISREIALNIIDRLRDGENIDSIGVNGTAVSNEDGSLTGIWVSSVQSGSPADQAGVQAGDIIYMLENLVLSTDGTMADYCDILRTHQPDDTMSMSVIRYNTGELLDGQLNGRELAVTGYFDTSTADTGGETEPAGTDVQLDTYNYDAAYSGDLYYATDFDIGLDDWSYFLTNGNDDGFDAYTENSLLKFDISDNDTWVYLLNEQIEMDNVRIDVTAENLGRNNNNVSLLCRYSDRGWYEFNIANSGEYTILRYDNVGNAGYQALFTGGSRDIKTGQAVNEYTAVCNGNELTLYINGVETRTVTDNTLKSGLTGLSVSSFNVTPIIVDFDYFILSVP